MLRRLLTHLLRFFVMSLVSNWSSLKDIGHRPPRISFSIKGERVQVVLLPGLELLDTLRAERSMLQSEVFLLIRFPDRSGTLSEKLARHSG